MERSDLPAWLQLLLVPGLGRGSLRRLLAALGPPSQVLAAPPAAWRQLLKPEQAQGLGEPPAGLADQLKRTEAWLDQSPHHSLLVLGDPDYPNALLQTADPPLLLYLRGRRELLGRPGLAIVGSRSPTAQGRDNARHLARELGGSGLTIVSGLALGIDGAAHEGALGSPGSTIAVLGCGLDQLYPPAHRALGERIASEGLLTSEFPLGAPPLAAHFPQRNRIIAGLSQGCVVVEAALRSGSLITARLAAEAGREVFAVPGSIHTPQSRGCHALLREGAKLVENAQDVLDELCLAPPLPAPSRSSQARPVPEAEDLEEKGEAQRVLAAMGYEPVGLDALQARGGWPTAQLSALLLDLELAGRIAHLPGQLFQRLGQA